MMTVCVLAPQVAAQFLKAVPDLGGHNKDRQNRETIEIPLQCIQELLLCL
jgi:hypothetical protein